MASSKMERATGAVVTNVTSLAEYRSARAETAVARQPITHARTPELCLILAMLKAMPAKARSTAMSEVMRLSDSTPDDEAGRVAAHLAACVVLAMGKR